MQWTSGGPSRRCCGSDGSRSSQTIGEFQWLHPSRPHRLRSLALEQSHYKPLPVQHRTGGHPDATPYRHRPDPFEARSGWACWTAFCARSRRVAERRRSAGSDQQLRRQREAYDALLEERSETQFGVSRASLLHNPTVTSVTNGPPTVKMARRRIPIRPSAVWH